MTNHSLAAQLKQIGLCALPTQLDDFIARVTKAPCSAHQILEELAKTEASERSRRSLERRLRISGIKRFKNGTKSFPMRPVLSRYWIVCSITPTSPR